MSGKHALAVEMLHEHITFREEGIADLAEAERNNYPDAPIRTKVQMIIDQIIVEIAELRYTISVLEALDEV